MGFEHTPVMPQEVYRYQNLKPGHICVDCTVGGAGHALQTVQAIIPGGMLIGMDQDIEAIRQAETVLSPYKDHIRLFHGNFSDLPQILKNSGIKGADSIVLDLGLSLNQIRNSRRGFSFNADEPLDMRMDIRTPLTAADMVNSLSENELADIFFRFGEERHSRRIARRILDERARSPIGSSARLSQIVSRAIPAGRASKQRIHPATRVFQALRIAVNRELEHLAVFMAHAPSMLVKGGRLCVISFHSLEDRIVKQALRRHESSCTCPPGLPECICSTVSRMKPLFRKPMTPSSKETDINPMARSARLRVAERI